MNNQHPINPPAELVNQWFDDNSIDKTVDLLSLATTAAQYGADQELEACVEWLDDMCDRDQLVKHRRPTFTNFKKQAVRRLYELEAAGDLNYETFIFFLSVVEELPND